MDVILVEPQTSGNVGAIARVMKNFGFSKLVLVNPQCDHKDSDARARAKHAKNILDDAEIKQFSELEYDYLIGTTARLGGDYNITRSPVTPVELSELISDKSRIGLVFGRENDGLSNEEIAKCDFVVSIPTNPDYGVMNLSHAVAIILYELYKNSNKEKQGEDIKPIGKKEKETLLKLIDNLIESKEFRTEKEKENTISVWHRLIGKGMLTNREAMTLMGFFRKL